MVRAATQAARASALPDVGRSDEPAFPTLSSGLDVRDDEQWKAVSATAPRAAAYDRGFDEFAPVEVYVPRERIHVGSHERVSTAANGNGYAHPHDGTQDDDSQVVESDDDPPF